MSQKLEAQDEAAFLDYCKSLGVLCKKLKPEGESGWPDRSLLYRGRAMFMELKRFPEEPNPLQFYMLDMLTERGFFAHWANQLELMKLKVQIWKDGVDAEHDLLAAVRAGTHRVGRD